MGKRCLPSPFLAGGYSLDPELPIEHDDDSWDEPLGGLHILRHAERYLQSIGKESVIAAGPYGDTLYAITGDCELHVEQVAALQRRYRVVTSPDAIRKLVRNQPNAVPLLHIAGGGCTGWQDPDWRGVRLARFFAPGQLFLLFVRKVPMMTPRPKIRRKYQVHLLEWQHPFPERSVATWTSYAELLYEPQPIPDRADIAFMFHFGHNFNYSTAHRINCDDWWHDIQQRPGLSVVR